ncbi:MAG: nucleoside triphosphate pyrophosphohydrolase, partial [Acidimicrobiales bacterium]
YEVLEAIEDLEGDSGYEHLEDELGDLLFQVAFHATLAAEAGQFDLAGVARSIHDKLVRRHPHVFDPDAPPTTWDQIKAGEKGRAPGVMSEVPGNLPALLYAHKVQRKAAAVGFDWESADGAVAKLGEELTELHGAIDAGDAHALNEELGDLLFSVVNVARHLDIDPEATLRAATAKFRARFAAVEALAVARGVELAGAGMDVLDGLWDEVKGTEGSTVF